jgi:hypothetical protein
MSTKTLFVAAAVALSTLGFAGVADAQVMTSSGVYYSPVVVPGGGTIVTTSGYTPYYGSSYYTPSYSSRYYSPYYNSGYYNSGYYPYSTGYYGNMGTPYYGSYFNGYNNLYNTGYGGFGVGTSGATWGGRRIWRW